MCRECEIRTKRYTNGLCSECNNEYAKKYYYNNKEKRIEYISKYQRAKKYNISKEQLNEILSKLQKCEICKVELKMKKEKPYKPYLCIDHNHKTNLMRGILCDMCNRLIGYAYDDIQRLKDAIVYLESKNQ